MSEFEKWQKKFKETHMGFAPIDRLAWIAALKWIKTQCIQPPRSYHYEIAKETLDDELKEIENETK